MTALQIADKIDGRVILNNNTQISGFYCGDSLARVMGKTLSKCGWLTVINNIDVAGVAALADIPLIILCEGVMPDNTLIDLLRQEGIGLIVTQLPVFEACLSITALKDGFKFSA